jgi:hypothetical protein
MAMYSIHRHIPLYHQFQEWGSNVESWEMRGGGVKMGVGVGVEG